MVKNPLMIEIGYFCLMVKQGFGRMAFTDGNVRGFIVLAFTIFLIFQNSICVATAGLLRAGDAQFIFSGSNFIMDAATEFLVLSTHSYDLQFAFAMQFLSR